MSFKDHYKTLRISPKASLDEIKKAYRTLAQQYHPDKNPDTAGNEALFHQIHEAYKILSSSKHKAAYDQERWLNGKSQVSDTAIISPVWMIDRAQTLTTFITRNGTTRIHQEPLADYITALLSADHITILQAEATIAQKQQIAESLYPVIALLDFRHANTIYSNILRMLPPAPASEAIVAKYTSLRKKKKRQALWEQYKPFVIVGIALLLVVIMMALQ